MFSISLTFPPDPYRFKLAFYITSFWLYILCRGCCCWVIQVERKESSKGISCQFLFFSLALCLSLTLSLFVTVCVYECKSTCVGFVNFKRLAFALLLLFSYTYEIVCVCMHGDCVCVCLFNFMKHARMLKKFFDWVDYKIPLLITE